MKPPIVIEECGDVYVYESVEDAQLDIEAIDVIDGVYRVFDSEGTILRPFASSEYSPVEIDEPEVASKKPELLAEILRQYVRDVGAERFGLTTDGIGGTPLGMLIYAILDFQKGR
jgi:hypothetical protein